MKRKWLRSLMVIVAFGLLGVYLSIIPAPGAWAAPAAQPTAFMTPTPLADGRIIYIVQADDTLWRIAAVSGVSVEQLRALNNLRENDVIRQGQELLLGLGGPNVITSTPGPTPTLPPISPTPTVTGGTAELCVLLYDDRNGDSLRQLEEPALGGGAISVVDRTGSVSLSRETEDGADPYCFTDLPSGDYNVSVAIPEDYNPTTVTNYPLSLAAGESVYLDFGAQTRLSPAPIEEVTGGVEVKKRSPLLGMAGGLLVLIGIGLGIYAARLRKL